MDITPTPEFMAAVRQVLGIPDTVPLTPQIVVTAMRSKRSHAQIREAHEAIVNGDKGDAEDDEL